MFWINSFKNKQQKCTWKLKQESLIQNNAWIKFDLDLTSNWRQHVTEPLLCHQLYNVSKNIISDTSKFTSSFASEAPKRNIHGLTLRNHEGQMT